MAIVFLYLMLYNDIMADNSRKTTMIQALKFLIFSMGAGIIQISSFTLFNEVFHWAEWLCHLVALTLSVLFNFTLNRKFTFKAANNVVLAMTLVGIFYLFFTPASTIYVKEMSKYANEYLVEFSAMVANLILEFIYVKFIVYGKYFNKPKEIKEQE